MSDWQDDLTSLLSVTPDMLMTQLTRSWRQDQENKPITLNTKLSAALNKCPSQWINGICQQLGLDPKALRVKKKKVAVIQARLTDLARLRQVLRALPAASQQALGYVLEQGGWVKLGPLTHKFGDMDDVGWFWDEEEPPVSPLGQLRVRGLLFVGKAGIKGRTYSVAVIPKELRELLSPLLTKDVIAQAARQEEEMRAISRLVKEERWTEAKSVLEAFLQQEPDSVFGLTNLGACYDQLGQFDRAVELFTQVVELTGGAPDALWSLALSQANAGQLEEAIANFERFQKADPARARAYHVDKTINGLRKILAGELHRHDYVIDTMMKRAFHLGDMGDWEAALVWLDRALALDPEDPVILFNRGYVLSQIDEDAAIEAYHQALRYTTDDPRSAFNLGNIYEKRGQLQESIAAYEQAIALDPTYPSPYHNLGLVYEQLGQLDKAIELWEKTLEVDPSHVNARFNLQRVGRGRRTAADQREEEIERQRQALAKRVEAFRQSARGATVYENDLARITLAPKGMTYESFLDELDCSLVLAPYSHTWLTDEQVPDLLRELRQILAQVHWTNTRELILLVLYDEWERYWYSKRFAGHEETYAWAEGRLRVDQPPAVIKLRADTDLRLNILPNRPQLKGLLFLLRTPDGHNLLGLDLGDRPVQTFG
jgi:tetratricopeptide (TPR) repeat protein